MLVGDGNLIIPDLDDYGVPAEQGQFLRRLGRIPISPNLAVGRAVIEGTVQHVDDVLADGPSPDQVAQQIQRAFGFRTFLAVPMRREGATIGVVVAWRTEPRPFTATQIALVRTFADQAVIAIENVRLFKELQASNRELTTALDKQTATAEILHVISGSPNDVQPVFNAIVENATRLCCATVGHLFQFDGELLSLVAQYNSTPEMDEAIQRFYPMRPSRGQVSGRAILSGTVVQIPDVFTDPEYRPDVAVAVGWRSRIGVPLLREGCPIGVIVINRTDPGLFADSHIELLRTFADQAVIAIENVRLFKELEAKNRALTEAHAQVSQALEQQTATSEILRVIASSPTDLQPVMDAVAENAARLCGATDATIRRIEGDTLRLVARFGSIPLGAPDVIPISRNYPSGLSVIERQSIHIDDILPRLGTEFPRLEGRTVLATPLLREGVPIGAILIRRTEVQPFTDAQIGLLQTFADQAVIAIENVRLFKELQASNRDLTQALD